MENSAAKSGASEKVSEISELMRGIRRLCIGANLSKHWLEYLIDCGGWKFRSGNLVTNRAQADFFKDSRVGSVFRR